tara:strand:+ start:2006 stop:2836 length:831 start_codon:yes stop_codon:yes gene_type:complete
LKKKYEKINIIKSLQNPLLKKMVKLSKSTNLRQEKFFLVEGIREINCALKANYLINSIFCCQPYLSDQAKILYNTLILKKTNHYQLSEACFEKMVRRKKTDGLCILFEKKTSNQNDDLFKKANFLLIIDEIEKPGNLGAILRTADAAGVDLIVTTPQSPPLYHHNVIRSSLGASFIIPHLELTPIKIKELCLTHNIEIIGSVVDSKCKPYEQIKGQKKIALILSSEDQGISPYWSKNCTSKITIPMGGVMNSLNVSVAAGIILFEVNRQRRKASIN